MRLDPCGRALGFAPSRAVQFRHQGSHWWPREDWLQNCAALRFGLDLMLFVTECIKYTGSGVMISLSLSVFAGSHWNQNLAIVCYDM